MNIYSIPFTYFLRWSKQDMNYYGVRFARGCSPDDLWTKYFTSSKHVKKFRKLHGEPDIIEIRRTFQDKDSARLWEHKVLTKMKVIQKTNWLNRHAGTQRGFEVKYGTEHHNYGKRWKFTEKQRKHQSETHKNLRWWNNGSEQSFSEHPPGPDYCRGRLPFNNNGARIGAEINSQKHWITNGISEKMIFKTENIPDGYVIGRSISPLKGRSNHTNGTHWWTDGTNNKMSAVSPGPSWVRGRQKIKSQDLPV